MKSTFAPLGILSICALGVLAGVSIMTAHATTDISSLSSAPTASWTAPASTPPGGQVPSPINSGTGTQVRMGMLGLGNVMVANLTVATGTPSVGQVLAAIDTNGTIGWATTSVASSGSPTVQIFTPAQISQNGTTNLGTWDVCAVAGTQTGNQSVVGNQYFYLTKSGSVWTVNANSGNNSYMNVVCWKGTGGGGGASSGVSSIIAGTNVTISPTSGTGDVTINATSTTTGSVGGGCYMSTFDSSRGMNSYSGWGNATGGTNTCSCASGYTVRISSQFWQGTSLVPGGYSCLKN